MLPDGNPNARTHGNSHACTDGDPGAGTDRNGHPEACRHAHARPYHRSDRNGDPGAGARGYSYNRAFCFHQRAGATQFDRLR